MEEHGVIEIADKVFDEKLGCKRGRAEEKGSVGRLEKRPSGIVVSEQHHGDEMINGVKYEEEKKVTDGGFFNQLISNLVSSPRVVNDQVKSGVFDDHVAAEEGGSAAGGGEVEGASGGGVVSNLISNIFHQNGGTVKQDAEEKKDGIVNQLPRTLSEDTVPATDEASILIHSIIHD